MTWEDLLYSSPLILVTLFALGVMVWLLIDIKQNKKQLHHS